MLNEIQMLPTCIIYTCHILQPVIVIINMRNSKNYFLLRPSLLHESFGNGIVFDQIKTELLSNGGKQTWYIFKQALREHVNCNFLCSGGHLHLKAKQFALEMLQKENQRMSINANIVATAIVTCKVKSAASSFESLLGLVSFCGADIRNIGHGW